MMHIVVLGSSAGGGLPQWNCNCANCQAARAGDARVPLRSQPCLAISDDGDHWHLVNAGPDIRQQILATPALHPRQGIRDTPIRSIVLTNADIDHTLGLLILRESHPYDIYATPWLRRALLESNALFRLLQRPPDPVQWHDLTLEQAFAPREGSHLRITPFAVPGKVPLYLQETLANSPEATIGLRIEDTRSAKKLVFMPGVQAFDDRVEQAIDAADVLMMDGTTFVDDEMQALGIPNAPTARVMGHWPVGGPDGTIEHLRGRRVPRKIFIHVNNTNPMLRSDSQEAAQVRAAGWEIAYEGMRIDL
jgi:pyrroloquinoline quinone biosynthesis protein B